MAENTTNLFQLSFDAINAMEKKVKLKGKVIVDNNIKTLCDQVFCWSENFAKLMESNEKLSSQFIVVKTVNTLLGKRMTELKKSQAKLKQYSRRDICNCRYWLLYLLDCYPEFHEGYQRFQHYFFCCTALLLLEFTQRCRYRNRSHEYWRLLSIAA